jgi:quercetin 2,3-dioxygenase
MTAQPTTLDANPVPKHRTLMIWGQIPLVTKIPTSATGGAQYTFEHQNMTKGGPPRHVHHDQDEWFYVLEGEYLMEVGNERFRLTKGDALFAPRKIPHAWACVSDSPGTLLTTVSPAGTFEAFLIGTTRHTTLPSADEMAATFEKHDMTLLGPPLDVG